MGIPCLGDDKESEVILSSKTNTMWSVINGWLGKKGKVYTGHETYHRRKVGKFKINAWS